MNVKWKSAEKKKLRIHLCIHSAHNERLNAVEIIRGEIHKVVRADAVLVNMTQLHVLTEAHLHVELLTSVDFQWLTVELQKTEQLVRLRVNNTLVNLNICAMIVVGRNNNSNLTAFCRQVLAEFDFIDEHRTLAYEVGARESNISRERGVQALRVAHYHDVNATTAAVVLCNYVTAVMNQIFVEVYQRRR